MIYNHYININIHNINGLAKKFIQVYSILRKNSNFLASPVNLHLLIYMHWFVFSMRTPDQCKEPSERDKMVACWKSVNLSNHHTGLRGTEKGLAEDKQGERRENMYEKNPTLQSPAGVGQVSQQPLQPANPPPTPAAWPCRVKSVLGSFLN